MLWALGYALKIFNNDLIFRFDIDEPVNFSNEMK